MCSEKESIHIVNLKAKMGASVQRETCKIRGKISEFKSIIKNDQQLFFSLAVDVLVKLLVH